MKISKKIVVAAGAILAFLLLIIILVCVSSGKEKEVVVKPEFVYGRGFVRGNWMITLKNKYPAFVKKVHYYSYTQVKAGDVILEYDDFDIRQKITAKENQILEQQKKIELCEEKLMLKQLDPLPSDFRNVSNKQMAARAKLKRIRHELSVYTKLHGNKIISDIALREKEQECKDAEADVESYAHDISLVNQGLAKKYIDIAQKELDSARTELKSLQSELDLLKEEASYYKIVAPWDGTVITNSDTVGGWDAAATAAAEMHFVPAGKKKRVYCYFDERDVKYVVEGKTYRFRSSQYDCDKKGFAKVTPYFVKKTHYTYGDRSLYLVQCWLEDAPEDLRVNSTGTLEVEIPAGE